MMNKNIFVACDVSSQKEIIDKIKQLDSKGFLRDQIYTEYPELRDNVELKEYVIKESFPDKLFYLLK